ncbi:MAG: hypothetical protein ABIJ97_04930 [Bacteroidota bacterium]
MIKTLAYCTFLCQVICAIAQDSSLYESNQIGFINHLLENELYDDAIFLLKSDNKNYSLSADSLYYYIGIAYYSLKQTDSSSMYFKKVDTTSVFYNKSVFYNSFGNIVQKKYDLSYNLLTNFRTNKKEFNEFKNFQLSSIALLSREMITFDSLKNYYSLSYFPLVEHEKNYLEYADRINNFKPRSKFVAGFLSGVIPGLGKVYTGKYGEGAAAFLMVSAMGLVTYENCKKDGLFNYKTIIFGGIFSVYYVGNIWGSVFSVKFRRDEFNNEINHQIMLDLHIPLRRIFE